MIVFSACVNDTVHLLYMLLFKSYYLLVMGFGSSRDFLITICIWLLSVYYKGREQISVLQ